ncbi:MAG: PPC domain-containing protein [Pirellulaceae bacterium]
MIRFRCLPAVCIAIAFASVGRAAPTLSHASPAAVEPGKTTQVVLHGDQFAQPLQVWTSFPAQVEIVSVEPKQATIKVTTAADVPIGPGGLLVANSTGNTEPIALVVDDLPSVADNGANHSPAAAQEIPALCAVDGVSNGASFDHYRFAAAAGQRIAVDVLARRIHSGFDPFVRLLDEAGNELLAVDDDPANGPDCRFSYTFAAAGNYVLELRDSKYSAGGRYRLRIGDFPLATTPMPLVARIGETRSFTFSGPDAAEAISSIVSLPNDPLLAATRVSAKRPGGQSSDWAELGLSEWTQTIESEPNNDLTAANRVAWPCGISGRLESPGDVDHYEFVAAKGQVARIAGATRSLGSPTLLVMRLFNEAGGKVVETPVNDADEWSFDVTFPADGVYRLQVEDLLHRGDAEQSYHVSIAPSGTFGLTIKNDKATRDRFQVQPAAGACPVDLQIARFGYDGPIKLSLSSGPAGLRLINDMIPAGAKDHRLFVAADGGWSPDVLRVVRVIGQAVENPRNFAVARSADLLRTRTPFVTDPANWRDGLVAISGAAAGDAFFGFKPPEKPVYFARPIGETAVALTLERKNAEFKDAVTVLPESLPAGFSAAVKADKDQYTFTITGPKDAAAAMLAGRFQVFGELKSLGRFESFELPWQVIDPLTIQIEAAGPLVAGQSQKVKIRLTRAGDDPQPVTLKWTKLPAGVTGDESMMIAADQSELEVELRAAAEAAAVMFEELTVEAASKFQGKDFTASSQPGKLEVKLP